MLIFDAIASVSDIRFTDRDLEFAELGDIVNWTAPPNQTVVLTYSMYLSMSTPMPRSKIGADIPVGTDQVLMPESTPLGSYTHIAIYTKSTFVEQSTPTIFTVVDLGSTVRDVTFTDFDLDKV